MRVGEGLAEGLLSGPLRLRRPCAPPGAPPGWSWWPQEPTPKQHAFLLLGDREALYGGAAGGGKSSALLMAATQYLCVPGYQALLIRRTFPQLVDPGGLIDRAKGWWGPAVADGFASWSEARHRLQAAGGGRVTFGFLNLNDDRYKFQSTEFHFAGFDELTHWPDGVPYRYVGFSRVRRTAVPCAACSAPVAKGPDGWAHTNDVPCRAPSPAVNLPACPGCGLTVADVPLRLRAGTNPGGRGHGWVKARFGLGRDGRRAPGRVFLPAGLDDNPHLDAESYRASLAELDRVERAQLERGDWDAREGGAMFVRDWFVADPDPSWLVA